MTIRLTDRALLYIVLMAVGLSLGWVLGVGWVKGFWTEATAAWVQAIGSIAAIIVGFLTVWLQNSLARREREAARRQLKSSGIAIAQMIVSMIEHLIERMEFAERTREETGKGVKVVSETHHLDSLTEQLEKFPIHSIANVNFEQLLMSFRTIVGRCKSVCLEATVDLAANKPIKKHLKTIGEISAGARRLITKLREVADD